MNLLRVMTAQVVLLSEETNTLFYEGQLSVIPPVCGNRINQARRRQLLSRATALVQHDRILCGSHDLIIGGDERVGLIKSAS